MTVTLRSLWAILLFGIFSHSAVSAPEAIEPAAAKPPSKDAFSIYILMGQSNMVGRDTRTLSAQQDNVHILSMNTEGNWVVAHEPMYAGGTGIGPGIPFATEMLKASPNLTIGLVPCAVGGTPLRRWVKGGDLYEKALSRAKLAAAAGTLRGVLWHQGESDTDKASNAETYEARLSQMLKDLRVDLGQPDLPIVVGQLGEFLGAEKYPFANTVRTAIRSVSITVPHVGFADSTGLGDRGDHLHFSATAEGTLGQRYASAMQQLESGPTFPPAVAALSTPPTPLTVADVWPEAKMPGKGAEGPEAESPSKTDNFHRITNISHPTLTVFPAPNRAGPAPAVIVCPGGGYNYVVFDKEGTEIAAWLNSLGISALVLKYRTPHNQEGAFQDLQRALSATRARAAEWKLDPTKLGVIGFSAGGHLAAKASNLFDQRSYSNVDTIDLLSCRPDFVILVYPAYLEREGKLASELNLAAMIPPTLLVHNEDDQTFIAGSKLYHAALDEAKKPNSFKLYGTGGHGYGLHSTKDVRDWPQAAAQWLHSIGVE